MDTLALRPRGRDRFLGNDGDCRGGAALAMRPRRKGTPKRSAPVVQTQIILAIIGALVMIVVGTSLARAFGVVGAAGLVRYRAKIDDPKVIWPYRKPMKQKAGFLNLKGNLFDSAIMKTGVISEEFRKRYLSNPKDPNAFEGRAIVFDGPEDYHKRIDDPSLKIDDSCLLFMRGTGPVGYPGGA